MIAYVPDAAADLPLIDGFIPGTALILPSQATTLPSSAVDLPHLAVGLPRLAVILPRGLAPPVPEYGSHWAALILMKYVAINRGGWPTVLAREKGCFLLLLGQSKFASAVCKDSNLEFSPEKD